MSQPQYRYQNQISISNFVFQFVQKMKQHFRYTDSPVLLQKTIWKWACFDIFLRLVEIIVKETFLKRNCSVVCIYYRKICFSQFSIRKCEFCFKRSKNGIQQSFYGWFICIDISYLFILTVLLQNFLGPRNFLFSILRLNRKRFSLQISSISVSYIVSKFFVTFY